MKKFYAFPYAKNKSFMKMNVTIFRPWRTAGLPASFQAANLNDLKWRRHNGCSIVERASLCPYTLRFFTQVLTHFSIVNFM